MITSVITKEQLAAYRRTAARYRPLLHPNRKGGADILKWLQAHFVLTEVTSEHALAVVRDNVRLNKYFLDKAPEGMGIRPRAFYVENEGEGRALYEPQNEVEADYRKDCPRIFVGIDESSGYFLVEGSMMLWNMLCAYQGLDAADIENDVCVAQYITCLECFDKLSMVTK